MIDALFFAKISSRSGFVEFLRVWGIRESYLCFSLFNRVQPFNPFLMHLPDGRFNPPIAFTAAYRSIQIQHPKKICFFSVRVKHLLIDSLRKPIFIGEGPISVVNSHDTNPF